MTKQQTIHVGMINSFNVITDRIHLHDVLDAGIGVFAHIPDEEITPENVKLMIEYFESCEMFENCAELLDYYNENFNDDGSTKEQECNCQLPEIEWYEKKMKCAYCKKRLKR